MNGMLNIPGMALVLYVSIHYTLKIIISFPGQWAVRMIRATLFHCVLPIIAAFIG